MKKLLLVLAIFSLSCSQRAIVNEDVVRWERRAQNVTIVRDDWGIPHIHGRTDADAVFGLMYAQAEDDFNRIEVNFLNSQGRLAEAEGEAEIYRDLRMKLFIDPVEIRAMYDESPEWLRALMDAWADGLNYYLYTHPDVSPRVITQFEPWMALTFSEGSIGGDIERVSLEDLQAFYGGEAVPSNLAADIGLSGLGIKMDDGPEYLREPTGSNGFAIAPTNTAKGSALLLINPHTSFYFRAEVHVMSDEGLNAYGAVTWGQFFVYQGFNETAGWMHTSSNVDNIDEYAETILERDGSYFYRYGDEERPVVSKQISVPYATAAGMGQREFTVFETHHGPVVRDMDGKWISVRLMEEPLKALTQSYVRTKAGNYSEFAQTMELHTNSSNNTVFADSEGNIAYFHSNFIPRRNSAFDWSRPVDGSDPETEWQGVHSLEETVGSLNPPNGWIQNTNNWPYSVAGENSPKQEDFPPYMDISWENPRGVHAIRVLENTTDFTIDSLIDAAYDSYLTAFDILIPSLLTAYDETPASDPLKVELADQVEALTQWDRRSSESSEATSLAVFWGTELMMRARPLAREARISVYDYMANRTSAAERLEALEVASKRLEDDFGSWRMPWGEINRFQRITGDIVQPFDDDQPSRAVGFASGWWGSLAAFGARQFGDWKKLYGTRGNSFVAVVEFGDKVRAKAVTAGGQSGDVNSPHFDDQIDRYCRGDLREVYFYPEQLEGHTEANYHPGER